MRRVIHRTDADGALGRPISVPLELATDGIEEVLELYLPDAPQRAANWPPPGVLRLAEADGGAVWSLQASLGSVVVQRGLDEVQHATEATARIHRPDSRPPSPSVGAAGDRSRSGWLATGTLWNAGWPASAGGGPAGAALSPGTAAPECGRLRQ